MWGNGWNKDVCLQRRDALWEAELEKILKKVTPQRLPPFSTPARKVSMSTIPQLSDQGVIEKAISMRDDGGVHAKLRIKITFPEFGGEVSSDAVNFLVMSSWLFTL
ncbi:UNVERIFIED_CONTAM: hypothetical protein FKN15_065465 [Acipenser sinensis]